MARTTHSGPWADTARAAVAAALAEVNVDAYEYITLNYADEGMRLEPVNPDEGRKAIEITYRYSEVRDQYRALLRRVPATPRENSEP